MRLFKIIIVAGLFFIHVTKANESGESLKSDWISSAKFALEKVQYVDGTIFVVDETVPDMAIKALRELGPVISKEKLPQQDEYTIPPGPYMLIRKFYEKNGIFEFIETSGVIKKGTMGHCGYTIGVRMRRTIEGAWELAGPMQDWIC